MRDEHHEKTSSETYGRVYSPDHKLGCYQTVDYAGGETNVRHHKKNRRKRRSRKSVVLLLLGIACFCLLGAAGVQGLIALASSGEEETTSEGDVGTTYAVFRVTKSESSGCNPLTGSVNGSKMSVIEAVAAVKNTVVQISTETVVCSTALGSYVISGAGSGVIISPDGTIATSYHVVKNAVSEDSTIMVALPDGTKTAAVLKSYDENSDLALLKIDAETHTLEAATFGCSADLALGEEVIAIGYPMGSAGCVIATGIISATQRQMLVNGHSMNLIQTNIPLNPGDSGGALFNMAGQLIGILNADADTDDSQNPIKGMGFAMPADAAYAIIMQLHKNGYIKDVPTDGLGLFETSSDTLAWRRFCARKPGVFVLSSELTAAILYGDRLVAVDGEMVKTIAEVENRIRAHQVGDAVTLTIERVIGSDAQSYYYKTYSVTITLVENLPGGVANAGSGDS